MYSMYVKLALFRCYCLPMYTAQLRWNHTKYTINRLLITYHNVFKMCLGLSKYESTNCMLCALTNIPCCQAVIRNLIFRFICRQSAKVQQCNIAGNTGFQPSIYLQNTTVLEEQIVCACLD